MNHTARPMAVVAIAAVDSNGLIGIGDSLPWKCKNDLNFFKAMTTKNIVVMGRNTALTLPGRKPLPNRMNIIVTQDDPSVFHPDFHVVPSFDAAKELALEQESGDLYVIGGAKMYASVAHEVQQLFLTHVHGNFATIANMDQSVRFPYEAYGFPGSFFDPTMFEHHLASLSPHWTHMRMGQESDCTFYAFHRLTRPIPPFTDGIATSQAELA